MKLKKIILPICFSFIISGMLVYTKTDIVTDCDSLLLQNVEALSRAPENNSSLQDKYTCTGGYYRYVAVKNGKVIATEHDYSTDTLDVISSISFVRCIASNNYDYGSPGNEQQTYITNTEELNKVKCDPFAHYDRWEAIKDYINR